MLSRAFHISPPEIRLISSYQGGGFGFSPRVEQYAAMLAFKTHGRPVRLALNREEVFTITSSRAHNVIYLKDGGKRDGTIIAREMKILVDSGAYAGFTPILVRQGGQTAATLYNIPNCKIDSYSVYTNTIIAYAMRVAGFTQPTWAIEQQMDIIAEKLGKDPVELRRKNSLKEGDKNMMGEVMHSMKATECMDKAAEWINRGKPSESGSDRYRRGKGIALCNKMTMIGSTSCALVKVCGDGTLVLFTSSDEIGQGVTTILAQIVAEEFGVSMNAIRVIRGDTALTPYDYGSVASRSGYRVRVSSPAWPL